MNLKDLSILSFKKNKNYDFILPLGATEQHGPFLPFGTDTYIVDYVVEQALKKFPAIIRLPTLEYSRSQEHRGFYGTIWLTEETLEKVLFDICNSLKGKARNIFITSFHANDEYIKKFIKKHAFKGIKIINLELVHEKDDNYIEKKLLKGPIDEHAGNSEISNMLVINKKTVKRPPKNYPKNHIQNPWRTDNLIEMSGTGIVDNHPKWNINKKKGKEILDIYTKRMIKNLKKYL